MPISGLHRPAYLIVIAGRFAWEKAIAARHGPQAGKANGGLQPCGVSAAISSHLK